MQKIFDKLRALDDKQRLLFQRVFGVFAGLVAWVAIVILGRSRDSLPWILSLLAAALVFLFRARLGRETDWNMRPYNIAFAIGIGVGMVGWLIYGFISGEIFAPA